MAHRTVHFVVVNMQIPPLNQQSKFQIYNQHVLKFLTKQRNARDEVKLIYPHQLEALFAVKNYFSATPIPQRPALVGNETIHSIVLQCVVK